MGGGYLGNAGIFLIKTLFGLFILAVLLRLLLQWVRADFYNPLAQFVVKVTNPALRPLRRFIPGYAGIDFAALVLAFALQWIELMIIGAIGGRALSLPGLLVLSVAEIATIMTYVFIGSILVQAIISWVNPTGYNPVTAILYRLNEPLLGPIRRLMPPIGGIDLSPLAVLIILQLVLLVIIAPLSDVGWMLALGR
ncbi:YggT family protein [Endothiovibrio diazotrophicus]